MTGRARPLLAALSFACAAALGAASVGLAAQGDATRVLAAALCSQGLWISLALGGALLQDELRVRDRLGLGPGRLSVGAGALAVVGFVALSHALHQGLVAAELRDLGALARLDEIAAAARGPALPFALLALGIAPGVAEELLFRGYVQRGLAAAWGPWPGILGAAAAFAIAHGDAIQGAAALAMGVYLGSLTAAAGSVRPAMACHTVNNTLGVLAAALGASSTGVGTPWPPAAIGALAALGLGALGLALRCGAPCTGGIRRAPPSEIAAEPGPGDP